MDINYVAVIAATLAQFAIGAIWYMPIFGKTWGKIHGFDKLNKKEQDKAQQDMMPLLVVQLGITFVTTLVLAKFILLIPTESAYRLALMIWLGFFVPVQIAAIIFGGTNPKYFVQKAVIMTLGSLVCLMAASAILINLN